MEVTTVTSTLLVPILLALTHALAASATLTTARVLTALLVQMLTSVLPIHTTAMLMLLALTQSDPSLARATVDTSTQHHRHLDKPATTKMNVPPTLITAIATQLVPILSAPIPVNATPVTLDLEMELQVAVTSMNVPLAVTIVPLMAELSAQTR